MDTDSQLNRIFDELGSIRAQLRSMANSISSNNSDYSQRLTAVERDFNGHVEVLHQGLSDKLLEHEGAIDTLSTELGKEVGGLDARVKSFESIQAQAVGMRLLWRTAAALTGAALVILNLWNILGRH